MADGEPVWLGGGEPTLRADLPEVIAALSHPGLETDGLALTSERAIAALQRVGLARVRVGFHCAVPAAHDWLVGRPGAARRTLRAIDALRGCGLPVEAAITVTRPTADHLEETVALLVRLGVRAIVLRRLRRRGPAAERFLMLSARLGLLEPALEAAVQRARDAGLAVRLDGFPPCAAPDVPTRLMPLAGPWLLPASVVDLAPLLIEPPAVPGCDVCFGPPTCAGAPADYVACFGRAEIDSEGLTPTPVRPASAPERPPPRQGRHPATRNREIAAQLARPTLQGDPLLGVGIDPPRFPITLSLHGTSREIRREMIQAAQQGSPVLRIDGGLDHPEALDLLRDATRLSASRVEICGHLDHLSPSDRELVGLRGVARFGARLMAPTAAAHDAVVGRPGAFERSLMLLERIGVHTSAEVGVAAEGDPDAPGWAELPWPMWSVVPGRLG